MNNNNITTQQQQLADLLRETYIEGNQQPIAVYMFGVINIDAIKQLGLTSSSLIQLANLSIDLTQELINAGIDEDASSCSDCSSCSRAKSCSSYTPEEVEEEVEA